MAFTLSDGYTVCIYAGATGAVVGAVSADHMGSLSGRVASMVAFSGLLTAFAGLLGQIGNNLVAFLRVWADNRRAERLEKLDRKALIEQVEHNIAMISDLRELLDEYRNRVESQRKRLDDQHMLIDSFYEWKKRPLKKEGSEGIDPAPPLPELDQT